MFNVAVIGIGMIGAAALCYLSKPETGLRVVGIGPAEPQDWATHQGAFASRYDQARITRITYPLLETPESMLEWFHSAGNLIEIEALQEVLLTIMPNLDVQG